MSLLAVFYAFSFTVSLSASFRQQDDEMIGFQIIEAAHSAQGHNDDVAFMRAYVSACDKMNSEKLLLN